MGVSSNLKNKLALVLGSKELAGEMLSAMASLNGNLVMSIKPTAKTKAATGAAWSEIITVKLVDADGNLCTWFSQAITTKVSVGDTSSAGTATINSTTITFVNGVATITLSGNAVAWLAAETATVTIASITVGGFTIAGGASVITFA